jgi:hypothetical protein
MLKCVPAVGVPEPDCPHLQRLLTAKHSPATGRNDPVRRAFSARSRQPDKQAVAFVGHLAHVISKKPKTKGDFVAKIVLIFGIGSPRRPHWRPQAEGVAGAGLLQDILMLPANPLSASTNSATSRFRRKRYHIPIERPVLRRHASTMQSSLIPEQYPRSESTMMRDCCSFPIRTFRPLQ